MQPIKEICTRQVALHHAYYIEGEQRAVLPGLRLFIEKELKFTIKNNPDFWCVEYDTFGIDDGVALKERASRKVGERKLRIFILAIDRMTHEAQNSLLKLFEEPVEGVHFFIIVPHVSLFLPTLRSRLMPFPHSLGDAKGGPSPLSAKKFLEASSSARLTMISKIAEKKDIKSAISFLESLEDEFHMQKTAFDIHSNIVFALEDIERCRMYLCGRAPSVKMILEHIALTVPLIQQGRS